MNFFGHRGGFTLVELLVVLVIIGVMAVMIGPSFTTGSDIARVKTAARGVMQMSRYARSMAVLHQTAVDLVFSSDGTLSVAQAAGGGESIVSAKAFSATNSAEEAEAEARDAEEKVEEPDDAASQPSGGGASYVMADLNVEKKYEEVSFRFEGFTDVMGQPRQDGRSTAEAEEEPSEGEVETFRVRYKSNGTCRPYRVRIGVSGDEGESQALFLSVDVLGAAKIEEEDE